MSHWNVALWLLLAVVAVLAIGPRVLARAKPEPARPTDPEHTVRLPRWFGRWAIVGPAVFVGLILCAILASSHDNTTVLLFSMAGPFAEPMAVTDYSWARMSVHGAVILVVASLHPIRPNELTALASLVAVCWWFLVGLGLTYSDLVAG